MAERILLQQGDLTISVVAPADDLRWIGEFFGESYTALGDAEPVVEVRLSCDDQAPEGGAPLGDRLAFALDSGPIWLPSFVGPNFSSADLERLLEADTGIAYDVSTDRSRVVVRYSGNRPAARVRLMRVVREYFHNASLQAGGIVLHAAAVVHDGRAIAIAGRKGAGKTTMLLRLLRDAETSFLSNDRVLVTGDLTPLAQSIPTVVSLRDGTLAWLPDIASRVSDVGDFRSHHAERLAAGSQPPVRAGGGIRLDARQLCDAVGRPMTPSAPLGAVIVIDEAQPVGTPHRLEPAEAAPVLASALLGSRSGVHASQVFWRLPHPSHLSHPSHPSHPSHLSHPSHPSHPSHLSHLVPVLVASRLSVEPDAVDRLLSVCAHACA